MNPHLHSTTVPGCYRCELSVDEVPTLVEAVAAIITDTLIDANNGFDIDTTVIAEDILAVAAEYQP
jgi:hypothetical protein